MRTLLSSVRRSSAADALLYAVMLFAVGASVYCLVRIDSVWLLPTGLHWPVLANSWITAATGSLPVLAHVLAMSWLTACALGRHSRAAALAGPAWAAINVAFEIGQHPAIALALASRASSFADIWLLERLDSFLLRGTFDPLDIAAAIAGGFLARAWIAARHEVSHVHG